MRVTTESGAVYEFTKDGEKFRRLTKRNDVDPEAEVERTTLRQDGKWLKLFKPAEPTVGQQMFLWVEPLAEDASVTFRQTSVVIGIE
jgi:hypothetical protein